jgi:peptidoglycan/LPS O-acetylase OafA/YrhL
MTSPESVMSPQAMTTPETAPGAAADGRLDQLDSLRGIAAVTVVLHHLFLIFPALQPGSGSVIDKLSHTPLHLFWSGTQAVHFFFVLSGFVLALPLFKSRSPYKLYAVKRIARIWIPYIAVVVAALAARTVIGHEPLPSLSDWFNNVWVGELSVYDLLGHFLLIPSFDSNRVVPVIWSLTQEMRISLMFPLLMLLVTRSKTSTLVVTGVVLYGLGLGLALFASRNRAFPEDLALSILFLSLFLMGAMLAKLRPEITERIQSLSKHGRWGLFIAAIVMYTFPHWGFFLPNAIEVAAGVAVSSMGSALFILIAVASERASKTLTSKPLLTLGRSSYSLYLVHTLVIVATLRAIGPIVGYEVAAAVSLILIVPATWICYQFVEKPATQLSRNLVGNRRGR